MCLETSCIWPGCSAFLYYTGTTHAYFHDTWLDLAADNDEQVRCNVAAHLHEVAALVGASDSGRLLRKPLVSLLRDTSTAVRSTLLPVLAPTLAAISGMEDHHR